MLLSLYLVTVFASMATAFMCQHGSIMVVEAVFYQLDKSFDLQVYFCDSWL